MVIPCQLFGCASSTGPCHQVYGRNHNHKPALAQHSQSNIVNVVCFNDHERMFDLSAKELNDGQCRDALHFFHKYHMLHAKSGALCRSTEFLGILEYIPGCTVQGPEFQHRLQVSRLVVGLTVQGSLVHFHMSHMSFEFSSLTPFRMWHCTGHAVP